MLDHESMSDGVRNPVLSTVLVHRHLLVLGELHASFFWHENVRVVNKAVTIDF